uniref:Metalloendopeptidase n=1 Tax=Heligmosomoides polygyrus TaxID=6339 RepID=A0A183G160_HELPZ
LHLYDAFLENKTRGYRSQADGIVDEISNAGSSRSRRQAFRDQRYPETIWRNDRVAFFFDKQTSERVKTVFRKGAKLWRDNTCIDIYEDTCGLSPDRIRVIIEEGCSSSHVGRKGGEQKISLGDGCETVAHAAHELGHALGFYHTQSRHDSSQSIKVIFGNINPDHIKEFLPETSTTNHNYGLPLDFGSIMLYEANATVNSNSFS